LVQHPSLDASHAPPVAERRPVASEIHGERRVDEYAWLREREAPEVTAYLEAENAYAQNVMASTDALQERLYDEILGHIKQTDLSVPYRNGAWWYYARTEEGKQYPIYARTHETLEAPEEIVLDLNALAEGTTYFALGAYVVSDDGTKLAYTTDTTGYRQYTLRIKDLRTGALSAETVERVDSVVWAADSATLFLVTEDAVSKRRDRAWRYRLGDAAPFELYEEKDERFDLGLDRSMDRERILLGAYSKATYQWFALDAAQPESDFVELLPRVHGHRYSPEHRAGEYYFVTNDGAVDFRVVAAPDTAPQRENWREVVPERAGIRVDGLAIFEAGAVLVVRSGGFANLERVDLETGKLQPVEMPETAHALVSAQNPDHRARTFRYGYQSFVTPPSVVELDLVTGERTVLKVTEVPGYDASAYATELVHATAADGTRVPISLVARRDTPRDGTAPALLYAYGSYGISVDPSFSAQRLVLLDRGFVFAIAHIRGGGELGERWRTSGHLREKLNTFSDFEACARFLSDERYTSAEKLAIMGGSAGGLLMGVVSNDAPQLFGAVVSLVPFVDVLNTMLDASLPLTTAEYLEWGDPNDPGDYAYMRRYSPYDNVRAQAYPATLVRVSINDSQVPYWEGAKLVARLRATRTNDAPLLLVTNFGAGHGGASGRYDAIRETAFNYAFILAALGIADRKPELVPSLSTKVNS
jgi:oligopeptidase B